MLMTARDTTPRRTAEAFRPLADPGVPVREHCCLPSTRLCFDKKAIDSSHNARVASGPSMPASWDHDGARG
jgi:hypothetical protein